MLGYRNVVVAFFFRKCASDGMGYNVSISKFSPRNQENTIMHVLRPICPLNLALALQAVAYPAAQPRTTLNFAQSFGVPGINTTFDYVVVGGGTAGLTIASRLAAEPSISVAVIEAGGFYEADGNLSVVPGYCTVHAGTDPADTDLNVDWGFVTLPQPVGFSPASHLEVNQLISGSAGSQ